MFLHVIEYLKSNGVTGGSYKDMFSLQDDGNGIYISVWHVEGVDKPTEQDLLALQGDVDISALAALKKSKTTELKKEAERRIHTEYSIHNQLNIIMESIVNQSSAELNSMNLFIKNVRTKSNKLEVLIYSKVSIDGILNINVSEDERWD